MVADRWDALVIGGGPAGATTALLLARAGWKVALLERKVFPRRKVCGEYLSATSLPLLDRLGIGTDFRASAGPPVTRVGLFAGETILSAELPRTPSNGAEWGRALARERLDTLLLSQAAAAGVEVHQPWSVLGLADRGVEFLCRAESRATGRAIALRAPVVVAAHGSWEPGPLATQVNRGPARASDLLGFKAHFRDADLPAGWMPLLAFPGGYGGMVHCDGGRVSFSCCIRRDRLARIRKITQVDAGEAVLDHIMKSCLGVRRALATASRDGAWLSAGPIQPGIRLNSRDRVYRVGNAAGEAHPVVAEGISMALQSAWLLAQRLIAWREQGKATAGLRAVAADYAAAWRRSFAPRVHVSVGIAHWAMRPTAVAGVLPVLRRLPALLHLGAWLSGKVTCVVRG